MIPRILLLATLLLAGLVGCEAQPAPCDGPTCDPFAIGQSFSTNLPYWASTPDAATQANDNPVNLVALHETKNGGCPTCPQARPQARPALSYPPPSYTQPTYSPPSYAGPNYVPPIRLNPGEVLLSVQPLSQSRPVAANTMPRPSTTRPADSQAPCPTGDCPLQSQRRDPLSEVKEGIFACSMCGRQTVGREWHELWTDDRISLTCMCEQCWRNASPAQIQSTIRNYAIKAGVNVNLATVKAVLREASAQ